MAYCVKCGEKVEDTAVICPVCGAVIPQKATAQSGSSGGYTYGNANAQGSYTYGDTSVQSGSHSTYGTYGSAQNEEGYFPESDVRRNKVMAVLCYIGVLVFIPIFVGDKQSEYLKLHKNQGIVLFIAETFLNILERHWGWSAGIFSWFTGGVLDVGVDIAKFIVLILFIMGIVYAYRGTRNELPGIGKIRIFK